MKKSQFQVVLSLLYCSFLSHFMTPSALAAGPETFLTKGQKSFPLGAIKKVKINNEMGKIHLLKSTDAKINVSYEVKGPKNACLQKLRVQNDLLKLSFKKNKKSPLSAGQVQCSGDLTVSIPANVDADLNMGMGEVTSEELTLKEIEVNVGQGNVQLKGNIFETEVKLGQGNVTLNLEKYDQKKQGQVEIDLGMGHVEIYLPKNLKINHEIKQGFGRGLDNDFISVSEGLAQLKVETKVGMGSVKIKGL